MIASLPSKCDRIFLTLSTKERSHLLSTTPVQASLISIMRSHLSHLVNKRAIALALNYSYPSKFDYHHAIASFSPCQQKSDRTSSQQLLSNQAIALSTNLVNKTA
ncbi:MAG: hypothetical protein V7K71_05770 [Nostoc sp.]|uniref:hypothetical protein n=1 Tax=Nostoc sp. TaxID=1180 RepID=UPI002FF8FA3B